MQTLLYRKYITEDLESLHYQISTFQKCITSKTRKLVLTGFSLSHPFKCQEKDRSIMK